MRKIKTALTILSSILFLFSCSRDDDKETSTSSDIENHIPSIPDLVFPTNNLTCTAVDLQFNWDSATDEDGDTLSYVIDIANDINFSNILFTATTRETSEAFDLNKGIAYFWRVKAVDSKNNESSYSVAQIFYTEPEAITNSAPTAPTLVAPDVGSSISTSQVTLDWNASDSDGDSLRYDLYFGTTNPPSLFEENISTSTHSITVSAGTTYYWKVEVVDSHQNTAISQIWNFRTE